MHARPASQSPRAGRPSHPTHQAPRCLKMCRASWIMASSEPSEKQSLQPHPLRQQKEEKWGKPFGCAWGSAFSELSCMIDQHASLHFLRVRAGWGVGLAHCPGHRSAHGTGTCPLPLLQLGRQPHAVPPESGGGGGGFLHQGRYFCLEFCSQSAITSLIIINLS